MRALLLLLASSVAGCAAPGMWAMRSDGAVAEFGAAKGEGDEDDEDEDEDGRSWVKHKVVPRERL